MLFNTSTMTGLALSAATAASGITCSPRPCADLGVPTCQQEFVKPRNIILPIPKACRARVPYAPIPKLRRLDPKDAFKIINGNDAAPGDHPYIVSLRYSYDSVHFCGGTLLTPQHVLTAAHCIADFYHPSELYVVSGTISSIDGGDVHEVAEFRMHEDYVGEADYWQNDIAILKLSYPMEFDENRQPVEIPTEEAVIEDTCTVIGWGYIEPWHTLPSNTLQTLNQIIMDETECQYMYLYLAQLTEKHLCAFLGRGYGACAGDSGGPLMCGGVQHGIVSFSAGCDIGYPDVYARVSEYSDWISENTQDVDET